METKAVYAGSFDPPTKGHEWVVREALRAFPKLVIAVAVNPGKEFTFTIEERLDMFRDMFGISSDLRRPVDILTIGNEFLVDWAADHGCTHMVRGIRNSADFLMEQTMRNINRDRQPAIETVFLMPPRELCEVSSSMVKGLVGINGWRSLAANYVSPHVLDALDARLPRKKT